MKEVAYTIQKKQRGEPLGLAIQKRKNVEGIFISELIPGTRLYIAKSVLKPNMRLKSLNDTPCPETVDKTLHLIKKTKGSLKIVATYDDTITLKKQDTAPPLSDDKESTPPLSDDQNTPPSLSDSQEKRQDKAIPYDELKIENSDSQSLINSGKDPETTDLLGRSKNESLSNESTTTTKSSSEANLIAANSNQDERSEFLSYKSSEEIEATTTLLEEQPSPKRRVRIQEPPKPIRERRLELSKDNSSHEIRAATTISEKRHNRKRRVRIQEPPKPIQNIGPSDDEAQKMVDEIRSMSLGSSLNAEEESEENSIHDPGEAEVERMLRKLGLNLFSGEESDDEESIDDPGEEGIQTILKKVGLIPKEEDGMRSRGVPDDKDILMMIKEVNLMANAEKKIRELETRNKQPTRGRS
jgi:hypothetical protein